MGINVPLASQLFVLLCVVVPTLQLDSVFTKFVVTPGSQISDDLPTRGKCYAPNRDTCALLCLIDDLCSAAFYSKSQRTCVTFGNKTLPWAATTEYDTLMKVANDPIIASGFDTFNKMVGPAYTTAGKPVARRLPYRFASDDGSCKLVCNSSSTCSMFGYSSSTLQCILFDLNGTASFAPVDDNLYTYYRYTTVYVNTSIDYSYTTLPFDVTNVSWITFSVKICNDAFITLQPLTSGNVTNAYEFFIGGWSNVAACLRRVLLGPTVACASGVFVDCNISRNMWISWTNGTLRFGTGNIVGERIAFNYTDPTPYTVKSIGVSSWGGISRGSLGTWSVNIPLWK